jgi:MFS family permease
LIGTIYFFGFIAGSTYFPRLADIYGRKPFVIIGGFMQSFCTLALIFSPNIASIYLNMFLIGIASPFLSSIGYNYLIELIPEAVENPVNTLIMCVDALGSLIGIMYFTYISVDVDSFLLIVAVLGIIASLFH